MAKLDFNSGLMYAAITSPHHEGETGYLNRKSGEILFVFENDEDAEDCLPRFKASSRPTSASRCPPR
jgi:hypothetical protein